MSGIFCQYNDQAGGWRDSRGIIVKCKHYSDVKLDTCSWNQNITEFTRYIKIQHHLYPGSSQKSREESSVKLLVVILKIGTPGVHVSTARESEMCYSFGTSVGDVTRLNVANAVRFSLYIWLIWKFLIKGRALPLP